MRLNILENGIVERHKDGTTTILRPGKNGGAITEWDVPEALANEYALATGDIVEGAVVEGHLASVLRINGLEGEAAENRPFPRTKRSQSERSAPDRLVIFQQSADDLTGRMLDFAAPLGLGGMGVIWGAHGTGLTSTLRAVLNGIVTDAPECVPLVLLLRARSEEITDWRRRFPQADVLCTSAFDNTPEESLRLADLVLEAARRQTELGKDVVLLLDSFTGFWAALLEAEEADDQEQADHSAARQRLREWVQHAGCFHNQPPLGGGLGGSLTIIGTVWHQPIAIEQEEEKQIHPHHRLLEHLLPEASWQIPLSETLARARLFPAIDVRQCLSRDEERFLSKEAFEALLTQRTSLPRHDPLTAHQQLLDTWQPESV